MFANALLTRFASRDETPNAAFRGSFQLGCVAAVAIGQNSSVSGLQIEPKPEIEDELTARVKVALFADAERKEMEAAKVAAAQAALHAEAEVEAARIAALPGLLTEAAKVGDDEAMKALLAQEVPIDIVDENGYTPLYVATMYEKASTVGVCLKAGAEVDKHNNNGVTPLMAAARDGYTAIVLLLLEAGADHGQVDEFGRTADSLAEEKGFSETAMAVREWQEAHPQ